MKIDRLVGILAILLQRDTITAPELAERFEVSRRTINRDVETLCQAGIPICTRQGTNGGISIMDDYRFDRTLLSSREMQDILAGLRGLDSVSGSSHYGQLMEKLSVGSSEYMSGSQSVLIDLSSWYKQTLASKIELIQRAVAEKKLIRFRYYSPSGEGIREIEPYYLLFRWSSWYVWGRCRQRNDFRMFKLNRLAELVLLEDEFIRQETVIPEFDSNEEHFHGVYAKILVAPEKKWRLIEEFGPESYQEQENGWLLFEGDYMNHLELTTWMMSFGDDAVLVEPESVRQEILAKVQRMMALYDKF